LTAVSAVDIVILERSHAVRCGKLESAHFFFYPRLPLSVPV
jgi:hypothetical protein